MRPENTEVRSESGGRSIAWLAGAVGAAAGVAALAYGRRRRSRWDRARDRANQFIDTAREQAKPWMGVAAGTAAASTAVAVYARKRKQSGWQGGYRRAGEVAADIATKARPWLKLGLSAAIALASTASSKKTRNRAFRGINKTAAQSIDGLAERGAGVLRRLRDISEEAGKLAPRVRRALA